MSAAMQYAWFVEGSSRPLTICEIFDQPGIRVEATHVHGSSSVKPAGGQFLGRVKVIGPKESVEDSEEEDALRKLVKEEIARKRAVKDAKAAVSSAIAAEQAAIDFRAQKEAELGSVETLARTKTEAKIKTKGRGWLGRKKKSSDATASSSTSASSLVSSPSASAPPALASPAQSPVVVAREATQERADAIRLSASKEADRKIAEMEAKAAKQLADAEKKAQGKRMKSALKDLKSGAGDGAV